MSWAKPTYVHGHALPHLVSMECGGKYSGNPVDGVVLMCGAIRHAALVMARPVCDIPAMVFPAGLC